MLSLSRVILRKASRKISNVGWSRRWKATSAEMIQNWEGHLFWTHLLQNFLRLFYRCGPRVIFSARGMQDCGNNARNHFYLSILACFAGPDEWRQALFDNKLVPPPNSRHFSHIWQTTLFMFAAFFLRRVPVKTLPPRRSNNGGPNSRIASSPEFVLNA